MQDSDSKAAADLMADTKIYDEIVRSLPASPTYITQLKEQLKTDSTCFEVMSFCQRGWPDYSHLTGPIKTYWPHRDTLSVHDKLLLKSTSDSYHYAQLCSLHEGHQGMSRCRERARETV